MRYVSVSQDREFEEIYRRLGNLLDKVGVVYVRGVVESVEMFIEGDRFLGV